MRAGSSLRLLVLMGAAAVVTTIAFPSLAGAQLSSPLEISIGALPRATSDSVDRLRLASLADTLYTFPLLRSPSSLSGVLRPNTWKPALQLLAPYVRMVNNSNIPFSQNDGALWAGRGNSTALSAGLRMEMGPLRVILAPELLQIENKDWQLRDTLRFYAPPLPKERRGGGFVFPWYRAPHSIDQPLRMGDKPIHTIVAGQSSVLIHGFGAAVGVATENEWWGPGMRSAIVLSDNASGFPHIVLRTSSPVQSRIGKIDARLIVGGIAESGYFDTTSTNNLRAISLFGASLQPAFSRNLTVGAARAVYGTVDKWETIPGRILRAFSNPGRPNNRALNDSSDYPGGEDQVYSLFARWVSVPDGFELYSEWARTELPTNLRDFFIAPNHTQGYTIGLQWRKPAPVTSRTIRLQAEATNLEQSSTFRDRAIGSYYTSRTAIQGYTNRGEVIGASIGPGASSQWLAMDFLQSSWYAGPFAGRIRWNEDMHSVYGWPSYIGYCSHDVTIFTGARGGWRSRYVSTSAELTLGNRLNAWFQEQSGCPNGPSRLDIRNRTLSISITAGPF